MVDEKNLFETGIAKTQIEAARRKLARNESLESLHEESVQYLNESLIILSFLVFVVSLALLLLYSNTNIFVLGLLIISSSSLVFSVVKTIKKKMQIREARQRDAAKYNE